jgi:hypothetical protein
MSIKEKLQGENTTLKGLILVAAIGIWVIALQNLGVIPISQKVKVVEVVRVVGNVNADVSGSVRVDNIVDVNVDNTVDVNLDEVLGYPIGCRRSYTIDGREYHSIDVSVR